jgi:hypothetical protein
MLGQNELIDLLQSQMWPAFCEEKARLDRIDRWWKWNPDKPHQPRQSTKEYKELAARSVTRALAKVVNASVRKLYVDGYGPTTSSDNSPAWGIWQANGMDARQVTLHREIGAYGLAYATVLPGTFGGEPMPVIRGVSPRRMISFWTDEGEDDYPLYALRVDPAKVHGGGGHNVRVYDDEAVHSLLCDASGKFEYVTHDVHGIGLCPVVRYTNVIDLEGRVEGEVEPNIPLAGRINQTVFDRLVVQRFASWKIRTATGLAPVDLLEGETQQQADERVKRTLLVNDILTAEGDVKFGTLDETSLDGFIKAEEADWRALAVVTDTPTHEMLGQMANLSAEALVAADGSHNNKVEELRTTLGERHEQTLRLASFIAGDVAGSRDVAAQVRWRDMQGRSLAQAADALTKLLKVGVPRQMLWEMIPGWTQQDVEKALSLAEQDDALSRLEETLNRAIDGGDENL